MKMSSSSLISYFLFAIICSSSWADLDSRQENSTRGFLQCLFQRSKDHHTSISNVTYTQDNSSYTSILQSKVDNLRFLSPSTPKPVAIITPVYEYQIQPVVYCSKKYGLQIRVRSGGHDNEGLSFTSPLPFVLIDLVNLKSVDVDVATGTAWVQTGATMGDLYNKIGEKSQTLGFPAAICLTVGVGGHFSGGGYGAMLRKYGLAADHIIDARLIDANGKILDRESMGEDLFWAIRGGGGGSFGIILAWKINLVPVPETVTVFIIRKTLEQNVTQILHRWQFVADKFDEDLFIDIGVGKVNSTSTGNITIQASFFGLFLGGIDRLLPLMQESFPELGLTKEDCTEMSWIESIAFLGANTPPKVYFKAKSDFVTEPIPIEAIEGMWSRLLVEDATPRLFFIPFGGKMNDISESAIPFPHRAGNLYLLSYSILWNGDDTTTTQRHITWIRDLYNYMTPYVSTSPRATYANFRDIDLGMNNIEGTTSYEEASVWGTMYFKNNFYRLAQVKTKVDPTNFFRHEQSIPLLSS